MKKLLLAYLLLICVSVHAQYENLLHKTYAERRSQLRGYYTHELLGGDEAARIKIEKIINDIALLAKKNNDEDLALEAALMDLHVQIKWKLCSIETSLAKTDSLRRVAVKKDKKWLIARTESLAALICFEGEYNYELGFDYLYKLHGNLQTISKEDFPEKQICYFQIGSLHYRCHDLENAIKYLKQGVRETPRDKEDQLSTETISLIGVAYQELNQLDSAQYYFSKALESIQFTRELDNQWVGIVHEYLGYNYILKKDFAAARPHIQVCLDTAAAHQATLQTGLGLTDMGAVNLYEGNIPVALGQLLEARSYLLHDQYYRGLYRLYPLLAKAYTAAGNHSAATKCLDTFLLVKDSLDKKYNGIEIARGRQRAQLQEKKELEDENRQKRFERNFLLAFVVLLMASAICIYIIQIKRHEQQKRIRDLELQQKQAALDFASAQLESYTREISVKNQRMEELQQKLGAAANEEVLAQLQQSTILTDEEWEHFRKLFAQVHAGYLLSLKEKLPDLSPAETRFMVLAKLKFTNKEMAAALGITPHAVRITWRRLRKKINLPEDGTPEELVAQI